MMEFTLSRVCMSVCGLILLASVIAPVTGMYDARMANMESDASDNIALMIDSFYYSEMEVLTINMNDILPDAYSYIELGDRHLTLVTEKGRHKSRTNVVMISDEITLSCGDIIRMSKNADAVIFEKLA